MFLRFPWVLPTAIVFLLGLGCSGGGTAGETTPKLAAQCIEDVTNLEADDWLCPSDSTVECEDGGANPALIYLEPSGDLPASCDDIELSVNDEGPFEIGTHDIVVHAAASSEGGEPLERTCEAALTVEDTQAPQARDEPVELWPPNHELHTISGEDCVTDACDGDLQVTFFWASSDEPVDDRGDGHTEPDIILACDGVQVRSERQGGSNGRVYRLGWQAVDDSGHEAEGECLVVVPHDQSGREAIDDGAAYELMLDPSECDDASGGTGGQGGAGGEGGARG